MGMCHYHEIHWTAHDVQGHIDMSGEEYYSPDRLGAIAEAIDELLAHCASVEERDSILSGTIDGWTVRSWLDADD